MTPAHAIFVAIMSALSFAVAEITVRNALRYGAPIITCILTLVVQCIILTVFILITGQFSEINAEGVRWFLLAGVLNPFLFISFYFLGIQRIGVTRAAPIKGSAPIFALIFAVGILGERLAAVQYLGIALVVGGVLTISSEGWSSRRVAAGAAQSAADGRQPAQIDYLFPLLAGVAAGGASILFKIGVQKMPSPLVGAWVGNLVGLPLFPFVALLFPKEQRYRISRPAFPWLLVTGAFVVGAMYTLILALSLGQVTIIFTLAQTSPLFVLALSVLFFRQLERVTPRIVLGAVLTVGGGALVSLF